MIFKPYLRIASKHILEIFLENNSFYKSNLFVFLYIFIQLFKFNHKIKENFKILKMYPSDLNLLDSKKCIIKQKSI